MSGSFPIPSAWPMILADLGVPEVRVLQRAGMPADLLRRAGGEALKRECHHQVSPHFSER